MIPGLAQWVGDLPLLWLWCRPTAAAWIRPVAQELPYAAGAALKKKKKDTRGIPTVAASATWVGEDAAFSSLGFFLAQASAISGFGPGPAVSSVVTPTCPGHHPAHFRSPG